MKKSLRIEMILITAVSILLMFTAVNLDLFEKIYLFSRNHENYEIDEIIVILLFASFLIFFYTVRNNKRLKTANRIIKIKNKELEKAVRDINTLKGIITICSVCKNIKVRDNYWQKIEDYISNNSDAQFSHGICMDCAHKLYPDLLSDKEEEI